MTSTTIRGILKRTGGTGLALLTDDGRLYKIHSTERDRLDLDEDGAGLHVEAEDAIEVSPPQGYAGWVKTGTLMIEVTEQESSDRTLDG